MFNHQTLDPNSSLLCSLGDKCLKIPQVEGAVACDPEAPRPRHIDTYLLNCLREYNA